MEQNTLKRAAVDGRRRLFLRAAGGAGALATLATVAGESAAVAPAVVAPTVVAAAEPAGYHETEHIRQYYRTAKYW
ncbi:formate dehydrogenase [Massilia sp. PWRC2]|uniref:formate dehydrogenase n=1 Tax=Massilia sp. PWRC2 TaxID=2804626 RepID=UPI003CED0065